MAYPLGEAKLEPIRVDFDQRLKLESQGGEIPSDCGLLPYREFDHAFEPTELSGKVLSETRRGLELLLQNRFSSSSNARLAPSKTRTTI